jgi:hypothetical protein
MKEAVKAGIELPPIIVNHDNRVIDGFHRTRAYRDLFGGDYEADVIVKHFKKDGELFCESARLNASHGLPLSPQDRAHVIYKARKMKVPWAALGSALGCDVNVLREFFKKRHAKTEGGETVILSNGSSDLSELDRPLNKSEELHARTANGCKAATNIAILLYALEAGNYKLTEKTIENMIRLRNVIDEILGAENER